MLFSNEDQKHESVVTRHEPRGFYPSHQTSQYGQSLGPKKIMDNQKTSTHVISSKRLPHIP